MFGNKRATEGVVCGEKLSICSDKKCERSVCEKIDMVEPVLSYLNGGGQKTQKSRFQIRGDFVPGCFAKNVAKAAENG